MAQSFHYLILTTVIMKLILLLVAIYSLIFYQQYKIEKLKALPQESESKTVKPFQGSDVIDPQGFENANFLIKDRYTKTPEHQIARLGFYE